MRDLIYRSSNYSGSFYPKEKNELDNLLDFCFRDSPFGPQNSPKSNNHDNDKPKIYGLIVPHGSYMFSGAVSANAFIEINGQYIDTYILIGPDHKGIGKKISIMSDGNWQTPFGEVLINNKTAIELKRNNTIISEDTHVHQIEHCLEIQIPFLQYSTLNSFTIVPILLKDQDIETAISLGNSIAKSITTKNAIIIATSDLTHYDSKLNAYENDFRLIKNIENLDIELFYQTIEDRHISICGHGAIASLMRAVDLLGAKKGSLLKYATSGDIILDQQNTVVAYAAIAFF